MEKIRSLKPNEIEIRVQQITANGVQLLLYKDSRCDKRILDETFGITGWKNKFEEVKGNLFCTISIWDDDKKQWIDKCDCGTESFSEKEKGEASDAFKRAGFNVGIGRELYTRIFYFANVPTKEDGKDKNGKPKYAMENPYEKFEIIELKTNAETEKIEVIKIADSKGKVVFSYPKVQSATSKVQSATKKTTEKPNEEMITDEQVKLIHVLLGKVEKAETQLFKNFANTDAKTNIYKKYKVNSSKELTKQKATEIIELLKTKLGENDENNK